MENRTFNANSRFKEGRKRGIRKIINLFIGGNIANVLMFYAYSSDTSFSSDALLKTLDYLVVIIGAFICNLGTHLLIRDNGHIIKAIELWDHQLEILTISTFRKKERRYSLPYKQISISKGAFGWNGEGDKARGLIIRDKKKMKKYYIIEAYFDNYEELSETLKNIKKR